jgi:Ca2+-binding RTX toxin-like protein
MRLRSIFVSVATVGLMVGPAFAQGVMGSVAGAAKDCTIMGTAADDSLAGTTRADVICTRAGSDEAGGLEGNDVIRGGQGDDDFLTGDDGSDTVKGQQDDDEVCGNGQNDKLYGGQGDDALGGRDATFNNMCFHGWDGVSSPVEPGNDFLKSRDDVSGNDTVDGGFNTDTCVIDAGDTVFSCEQ